MRNRQTFRCLIAGLTLVFTTLALTTLALPAKGQDTVLTVPDELVSSGLWDHVLPRFALKTRVRVTLGPAGALSITASGDGQPVFIFGGTTYRVGQPASPDAERLRDWLLSEVGRRTIAAYPPDDGHGFSLPHAVAAAPRAVVYDGDADLGETLSMSHCGRCHVVSEANRLNGLGSTPSFGVLRAMPDWAARFEGFFALNPHGAFTQIDGLTQPFPMDRPPPIAPMVMTRDDLDAILAFVAGIAPADLGAPIRHQ